MLYTLGVWKVFRFTNKMVKMHAHGATSYPDVASTRRMTGGPRPKSSLHRSVPVKPPDLRLDPP